MGAVSPLSPIWFHTGLQNRAGSHAHTRATTTPVGVLFRPAEADLRIPVSHPEGPRGSKMGPPVGTRTQAAGYLKLCAQVEVRAMSRGGLDPSELTLV